jgi:hypothetical protein
MVFRLVDDRCLEFSKLLFEFLIFRRQMEEVMDHSFLTRDFELVVITVDGMVVCRGMNELTDACMMFENGFCGKGSSTMLAFQRITADTHLFFIHLVDIL